MVRGLIRKLSAPSSPPATDRHTARVKATGILPVGEVVANGRLAIAQGLHGPS